MTEQPASTLRSLADARNIGASIAQRLNEIGIFSLADLADRTPAAAYRALCERYPAQRFPVCYYLYSLQGALLDVHWNELPGEVKAELRKQAGR
ncbi:MAG: TfoX/Sxy family DNA transformation protein [Bacteroidia bacterium]|nr:TfoX/Sxy family DNA transformation protein [Bacteroidia bacterium]